MDRDVPLIQRLPWCEMCVGIELLPSEEPVSWKRRSLGQKSELDLIHLFSICIPAGTCVRSDRLIWPLNCIFWWEPNVCGSWTFSSHHITLLETGSTARCEKQQERAAANENISHSPPSAFWTPLLSASSFAPRTTQHPTTTPLYTSPPNRAESVKNLTNGFICCQICADLSFPWTILLDTFHSWVSPLAFWLRDHQGSSNGSSQSDSVLERESLKLRSSRLLIGTLCRRAAWASFQKDSLRIVVLIESDWRCGVGPGLWLWWQQCCGLSASFWMGWKPRKRERGQRRPHHSTQRPTTPLYPTVRKSVEAPR